MDECNGCKFNKEDVNHSYRICAACTGDANEAYNKVFTVTKQRRLICQA